MFSETHIVHTSIMGIDIGKRRDPPAICCVEAVKRGVDSNRPVYHFIVRHLERLPRETGYRDIAARVAQVAAGVQEKSERRPQIYVDATGIGTPIIDILRQGRPDVGSFFPVFFTHGDRRSEEQVGRYLQVTLGKAFLVGSLKVLLQMNRIHLPRTTEMEVLVQELMDFETDGDGNANERYGAFRVGTRDELVTALGLAVNCDPRITITPMFI